MSDMSAPPFPISGSGMSPTRRVAFAAWNKLRRPEDPEAETLPEDTQMRIEAFAREVRNGTIDQLAGAIKRFNDKNTALCVDSLQAMKD